MRKSSDTKGPQLGEEGGDTKSDQRLEIVLQNSDLVLWEIDKNGIFTFSAGKGLEKLGLDPQQAVGWQSREAYVKNQEIVDGIDRALAGEVVNFQTVEEGNTYVTRIEPFFDESGSVVGARGISNDVTLQSKLKEMLTHIQYAEEIGKIAGGVAHEVNNELFGVLILLEHFRDSLGDVLNDKELEYLKMMNTGLHSVVEMNGQLLDSCKKQDVKKEPIDIGTKMPELMGLVTAALPKHVSFSVELGIGEKIVFANEYLLRRILLNLINNAGNAIEAEGRIKVSVENVVGENDDEFVCISVMDNGCGMTPEKVERVFEPYFTTREETGGSGLGLAIVKENVEEHGGRIAVRSAEGVGTTFEVYLPLLKKESKSRGEKKSANEVDGSGKTVLIVDDEQIITRALNIRLGMLNFNVLVATTLVDARRMIAEEDVDFLMCDVNLPDGDGVNFVRELDGSVDFCFMSGHLKTEFDFDDPEGDKVAFLHKPFNLVQAVEMLRVKLKLDS